MAICPEFTHLAAVRTMEESGIRCVCLQFSSFQSFDLLVCRGDTVDDSAEILVQSFLREAVESVSDTERDVHSVSDVAKSIQHFMCRPRCRPPFKMPGRMVLERQSWLVIIARTRPIPDRSKRHERNRLKLPARLCISRTTPQVAWEVDHDQCTAGL